MAVHPELISVRKFDEKFKNALRDYYSYGFKNYGNFAPEYKQTLSDDWKRLNNILADYFEWSEKPNKIMFISLDSQSVDNNVFHRVYRFCGFNEKDPVYFLHVMAALCKDIRLRDGVDSLKLEENKCLRYSEDDGKGTKKRIVRNFEPYGADDNYRQYLEEDIEAGEGLSTAQLMCFYPDKMPIFSGENKKTNNRLESLENIGFIQCIQEGEKGDKSWKLAGVNLQNIINEGKKVNKDFEQHLKSAIDFYSKYYFLGEIGTYLLDRIGEELISPFRFKHEYFMQTLNDFNLIDLLYAMENKKWCLIKYKHGILDAETELLCYPLEVRIGTTNGRQSLIYYEPFMRGYTSMRLEFIESIGYLDDTDVKKILNVSSEIIDTDIENARYATRYMWGVSTTDNQRGNAVGEAIRCRIFSELDDSAQNREESVKNPKNKKVAEEKWKKFVESLKKEKNIRDVEVSDLYVDFTVDVGSICDLKPGIKSRKPILLKRGYALREIETIPVKMRIAYRPDTEYYIKNRIERERRIGKVIEVTDSYIDFEVNVTSTSELRPWIRSFYSRLLSCEGMDKKEFSIEKDILDINEKMDNEKILSRRVVGQSSHVVWGIPLLFSEQLNESAVPAREHEKLFHESFSVYFYVISNVFMQICQNPKGYITSKELNGFIKEALGNYYYMIGMETENLIQEQIKEIFLSHGFLSETELMVEEEKKSSIFSAAKVKKKVFLTKYSCSQNMDFYKDIVPLTVLELRWLLTIFNDKKIAYFMNQDEIDAIVNFLKSNADIHPFLSEMVKYFDRADIHGETSDTESKWIRILLRSIESRKSVKIEYCTMRGKVLKGEYRPAILEFSKKESCFRGYFQSCNNKKIYIMNVSGIKSIEITDNCFDYEEILDTLAAYRSENERHVEIEFYDVRNMADRLLTEFSPWKKKCIFEKSTGLYKLKIFYQSQDETELVVRLMGYGADVHFPDSNHPICREITRRIHEQMKIMKEKNYFKKQKREKRERGKIDR